MRVFREPEADYGKDALTFTLGALGGLAIGMLISRRASPPRVGRLGSDLRERARSVARGLRPARLRRMSVEQDELSRLEDAVLDVFLSDQVLSERGIDVGAISRGIIELSGSVWSDEDAERAVRVANAIPGVETVVNRLEIETEREHLERTRRRFDGDEDALQEARWSGRMVGMSRRRQGHETDPDRPDDSQHQTEVALRDADLDQYEDEDIAYEQPRVQARSEVQREWRKGYDEDELDNQDPHGKHTRSTRDAPPQELNSSARVGEGLKTGEHLSLEQADVPVKPHGGEMKNEGEDLDTGGST